MITTPWNERSWIDYLTEAKSLFDVKHPEGIAQLIGNLENIWEKEESLQELYRAASSVIAEPNVWIEVHDDDDYEKIDKIMQPYFDKWETSSIPKGQILEAVGSEWLSIVDHIEKDGY